MSDLIGALAFLEVHGIVHMDLKPKNIVMRDRGVPKIIVFNLGKCGIPWGGVAVGGGTRGYRALEVMEGKKADSWADVFALGVIVCEMVMLRLPWDVEPPLTEIMITDFLRSVGNAALKAEQFSDDGMGEIINKMLRTEPERTVPAFLNWLWRWRRRACIGRENANGLD